MWTRVSLRARRGHYPARGPTPTTHPILPPLSPSGHAPSPLPAPPPPQQLRPPSPRVGPVAEGLLPRVLHRQRVAPRPRGVPPHPPGARTDRVRQGRVPLRTLLAAGVARRAQQWVSEQW